MEKRRTLVRNAVFSVLLVLWVVTPLLRNPVYQVTHTHKVENHMSIYQVKQTDTNLWYSLLKPETYLEWVERMPFFLRNRMDYRGKKLEWHYPVFLIPKDQVLEEEINQTVQSLLKHSRSTDKGIDYYAELRYQIDGNILTLKAERIFYPYFAATAFTDSKVKYIEISIKSGRKRKETISAPGT